MSWNFSKEEQNRARLEGCEDMCGCPSAVCSGVCTHCCQVALAGLCRQQEFLLIGHAGTQSWVGLACGEIIVTNLLFLEENYTLLLLKSQSGGSWLSKVPLLIIPCYNAQWYSDLLLNVTEWGLVLNSGTMLEEIINACMHESTVKRDFLDFYFLLW